MLACACALGADAYQWDLPQGFPAPRVPATNPMSEAKVRLGRYLFYDKRLSVNGSQSCATCHRQELAFTDGRATAIGSTGQAHSRSAMSLVNVAYLAVLTWSDPQLRSLERQALVPMLSEHPVELGLLGREATVLRDFRADPVYRAAFPQAFPEAADPFTIPNVAKALATFERTILSARSPYDRYYFGRDPNAISDSAKRGEGLFFSDVVAGCFRCHAGFNFSDATQYQGSANQPVEFHNTAVHSAGSAKFRTPSVRNAALTGPYMHDGSMATLDQVLDHYAAGGRGHVNPDKDKRMTGIALTAQNRKDLLEFLRSLTDQEVIRDPRFSNPW